MSFVLFSIFWDNPMMGLGIHVIWNVAKSFKFYMTLWPDCSSNGFNQLLVNVLGLAQQFDSSAVKSHVTFEKSF